MRWICALLVTLWIGCGTAGHGDDGPACEGLRCQVVDCESAGLPETSLTGTVFAPNETLRLYGVSVYVPNGDPGPLPEGVQCARCSAELPGDPIAQSVSDTSGRFTLRGVPSGEDIPLVITSGKWRRQVRIPLVPECTGTELTPAQTSLPKQQSEGDMPRIAIATGNCDAPECLLRKLGIADAEFTNDAGGGRVHMFASNGANRTATQSFAPASNLWGSIDKLRQYDLAMFSCECMQQPFTKPQPAMDAVKRYADEGGRLFLSHFHNIWISGENGNPTHAPAEWPQIASCNADVVPPNPSIGVIDQVSNPRGLAFASWMVDVRGSTTPGQLEILEPRQTCTNLDPRKAERWLGLQSDSGELLQNFQFTTPSEQPVPEERCGKVVFSDMHVASGSTSMSTVPFPGGCSIAPMTAQEKALAFMFFDLASCVGPIL